MCTSITFPKGLISMNNLSLTMRNYTGNPKKVNPKSSLFEKILNSLIFEKKFTPHLLPPPTHEVHGGR